MELNCDKWFYALTFALFIILAGLVMIFKYFLKLSKDGVSLKKNDQLQEEKHKHNETRIKELEKKNGAENKQLDELKKDNGELKDMVIKLQERIINYEKKQSRV